MMCLIVICVWIGSTISQTPGTNETHANTISGFPLCNRRRASLTTYLFLFSMITKIWSGFREPQKDHGNGEYLHFQFVWSFGLSIEVVCCFVSCFVSCFVFFFVGRNSLDPSLVYRCDFAGSPSKRQLPNLEGESYNPSSM
jgi:hypothetical protein